MVRVADDRKFYIQARPGPDIYVPVLSPGARLRPGSIYRKYSQHQDLFYLYKFFKYWQHSTVSSKLSGVDLFLNFVKVNPAELQCLSGSAQTKYSEKYCKYGLENSNKGPEPVPAWFRAGLEQVFSGLSATLISYIIDMFL